MSNKSMGEIISALRKEKGMTQKELADRFHITDKAVSKWERNLACPDIQLIPDLAEVLGISVEELLNAKPVAPSGHRGAGYLLGILAGAIPLTVGVAVTVTSALGALDTGAGFALLGIGLACVGLNALKGRH